MDARRFALALLAPLPAVAAVSLLAAALTPVSVRFAAFACSIVGALLLLIAISLYELTVESGGRPDVLARAARRNDTDVGPDDRTAVLRLAALGAATLAWSLLLAFAPY